MAPYRGHLSFLAEVKELAGPAKFHRMLVNILKAARYVLCRHAVRYSYVAFRKGCVESVSADRAAADASEIDFANMPE